MKILLTFLSALLPLAAMAQSKYQDIAAGLQHAIVLKTDGSVEGTEKVPV